MVPDTDVHSAGVAKAGRKDDMRQMWDRSRTAAGLVIKVLNGS